MEIKNILLASIAAMLALIAVAIFSVGSDDRTELEKARDRLEESARKLERLY